ncbi:MAG: guanylate kinase [Alphaproteobacteria bacterium]|nr:guanylate kinase [Alphaproteobacteria bacterium]
MTAHSPALEKIQRRGLMLVLSSPSGAGKTTISRRLLDLDDEINLSISMTTRRPRPGEEEGRDYHFIDPETFDLMAHRGDFLEHARVFGHYYGTPLHQVQKTLSAGRDVLFDIDWQGTQQIAEKARDDLVSIFVLPPSWQVLERRLHTRAQDAPAEINRRMAKAADEMSHWAEYDYIIINHDLEASIAAVHAILQSERLKRSRQVGLAHFVKDLQKGA